jgi:uncharacterized membrane protein YccC
VKPGTKSQATLGLGGIALIVCCMAAPAALGAIGGAATDSLLIGAIVAVAIALGVYAITRRLRDRSSDC